MAAHLEIIRGNIVEQKVEIIVTAANEELKGGGGVDAAVHKACGPELLKDLRKIGRCPVGSAVITDSHNLHFYNGVKHIIHAVGPIYKDGNHREAELLASAYATSMRLAADSHSSTIAFPAIGTGAYGFPLLEAATIAIETLREEAQKKTSVKLVRFVAFSDEVLEAFLAVR